MPARGSTELAEVQINFFIIVAGGDSVSSYRGEL